MGGLTQTSSIGPAHPADGIPACYTAMTYPNPCPSGGAKMKRNIPLLATPLACSLALISAFLAVPVQAEDGDQAAATKDIFVFFDGTQNTDESNTNVYRLYQLVSQDTKAPSAKYFPGVGAMRFRLLGSAFGKDMESKILDGYTYIAQNYRPGDRIFIFGFSRGAHEARSLAGLISYAGVQPTDSSERELKSRGNRILELVKSKTDEDFVERWGSWKSADGPLLGDEIKTSLGINTLPAEIEFLGAWDTVPGSSFLHYGPCKEKENRRDGDRYKTDSYPPIKAIAHAVALDEKRSKFRPLLICDAIDSTRKTIISEKWFPGAHSDVGGGYKEGQGLTNISLNWMLEKLANHYRFEKGPQRFEENPLDVAHWSVGDKPGNKGSECEDRNPSQGADISEAAKQREKAGAAPLIAFCEETKRKYPVKCEDLGKSKPD